MFEHYTYEGKPYSFIRQNGGWDNWKAEWIENYPCNNKAEANARLYVLINELKPTLNNPPSETMTKKWHRNYSKEYYHKNIKNKFVHCDICDINVKYESKSNHQRCTTHILNTIKHEKNL